MTGLFGRKPLPASTPPRRWIRFLLAFDVGYRKRRLRFLIEGQNRLTQMLGSPELEGLDAAVVDRLKRKFYECTEALERRETVASVDATTCNLVEDIFRAGPSPTEVKEIAKYAQSFVARHKNQIDALIEHLGSDIDLKASTSDIDVLLAESRDWPPAAMREVLVNYLGFPFWDVVTFPVMPWREAGEFNEVKINRISAQDATGINRLGTFYLKGTGFNQSAAFLSRVTARTTTCSVACTPLIVSSISLPRRSARNPNRRPPWRH